MDITAPTPAVASVFIVCADPLTALAHRDAIERSRTMKVVGMTSQRRRALPMMAECRPDVLVAELTSPEGTVLGLLDRLAAARGPATPVMLLAEHAHELLLLDALRAGASSYWPGEPASPGGLGSAVQQMLDGEAVMSAGLARRVLAECGVPRRDDYWHATNFALHDGALELDEAERAMLIALARGMSLADVAQHQRSTAPALRRRIRAVYRKLQWQSRTGGLNLAA